MSSTDCFWLILSLCRVVSSLALSSSHIVSSGALSEAALSSSTGPSQFLATALQPRLTARGTPFPAQPNTTTSTNEAHHCDADIYGRPHLHSCRLAWDKIPDTSRILTFGNRPPRPEIEVTVPYRFTSRKPSSRPEQSNLNPYPNCADGVPADGLCALEFGFTRLVNFDHSSSHDMRTAAAGLIFGCVETFGMGGSVNGLGTSMSLGCISLRKLKLLRSATPAAD